MGKEASLSGPLHNVTRQHGVRNTTIVKYDENKLKGCFEIGVEERALESKSRWNPKPEQMRILEYLFKFGVVNPSRGEIRQIIIKLEEYKEVGDANVFYWF
nr:WUSCHEL-related homeobox 9 [Ipomoea batatas]